jgi:hypothetical protein
MDAAETALQSGIIELEARKAALELQRVSGLRRRPRFADQFESGSLRRSRASLIKRRHTS